MAKLHQLKLCPSFLHTTKYEQDSLRHPRCMEKNSSQYLLSERAEIIFFFYEHCQEPNHAMNLP